MVIFMSSADPALRSPYQRLHLAGFIHACVMHRAARVCKTEQG